MTTEQHLQQLIGTMAFQLAQSAAQVDALQAEVLRLKAFEPKPRSSRKTKERVAPVAEKTNGAAHAEA